MAELHDDDERWLLILNVHFNLIAANLFDSTIK